MGWVLFSFHLQRSYSLVVFNQCATLYLVRIFSAARCAGFRQEKSPGRVGRCRIPQRKASDDVWGFFFVHPVRSFFQVVFKPTSNIVLG